MVKGISKKFLSFSRFVFFNILSVKFNSAPFKNLMDNAYVIFEKIAFSFEFLSSNYLKLYDELIDKEIKMAQLIDKSSILIIGCGSLPVTPILIGKKTNANIVGIDYDLKAVKRASSFIKKSYPSLKINIEHADGLKYPIERFDVIFVSYGVKNQIQILKRISEKMKSDELVIFRTTQDVLEQKFKGKKLLSDLFNIKDSIGSESIYTSYSYLLTKK